MSSRRLQDMGSKGLQDMSSRRLEDVFSVTIFRLLRWFQNVFMFAGFSSNCEIKRLKCYGRWKEFFQTVNAKLF